MSPIATGIVGAIEPMGDGESWVTVRVRDAEVSCGATVVLLTIPGAKLGPVEDHLIRTAHERLDGNTRRMAEALGLSVRAIQYKRKQLGLKASAPKEDGAQRKEKETS